MRVIGYTYDADCHCVSCASARFPARNDADSDENGVSLGAFDSEGNSVHPIFSTDDHDGEVVCGDCFESIAS